MTAKRDKVSTDYSWGMKIELGGGIDYSATVDNEITCEYIPVTDDEGEPVFTETLVEARDAAVVRTPVTRRSCITLFADKD